VADSPQQTIRELRELIVAYVKQETIDPIKGLGRYLAFGVLGALLTGFGVVFLAMSLLRALQGESDGPHFTGNWSWVPYLITVVALLVVVAIAYFVGMKQRSRKQT
jgi:uncharacterized BrkB/YihY/UPF0761 family membrane protein